jgi:hypothetical protein
VFGYCRNPNLARQVRVRRSFHEDVGLLAVDRLPGNEFNHAESPVKVDEHGEAGRHGTPVGNIYWDAWIARMIEYYVNAGLCERYPLYVLDFVMWPHRDNMNHRGHGGSGRIVATWDGHLLGQRARHAPKLKGVFDHRDGVFESSPLDDERTVLEHRRSEWFDLAPEWHRHQSAHEFASMYCLGISVDDATEDANTGPSPDTWYTNTSRINVVDVQAVAVRAGTVSSLAPRSMLLMPFPTEVEARLLEAAYDSENDVVIELVREAITVADSSRRGVAVVLRTLAEVVAKEVVAALGVRWDSLDAGINRLEKWLRDQTDALPNDKVGKSNRRELLGVVGRTVHSLNLLREHGNRVHEPVVDWADFDEFNCATDLLRVSALVLAKIGS